MPDISSIGHNAVGPIDRTSSLSSRREEYTTRSQPAPERPGDRVELSSHARYLDRIRALPDARYDRVEEIRHSIKAGTYSTDEKLSVAIDRLVDDLTT